MAFVMLFVFWIWMYQVRLLLALFLGVQNFSDMAGFLCVVFSSIDGLWFLLVGHVIGAVLSLVMIIAASLPAFLGLLVLLPVLGHTTWHLYRRAVVPATVASIRNK